MKAIHFKTADEIGFYFKYLSTDCRKTAAEAIVEHMNANCKMIEAGLEVSYLSIVKRDETEIVQSWKMNETLTQPHVYDLEQRGYTWYMVYNGEKTIAAHPALHKGNATVSDYMK